MGYSKRTKVITQRGRKNPRVKQDGSREFVTAMEAVLADGYVFPSFLTTSISISRDTFYPLFKKARSQAYSLDSIRNVFCTCGIVPLQARSVLEKLQAPSPPTPRLKAALESLILEQTPHSKCELRQQTALALNFVKRAMVGEISQLILQFSHTAEYALGEVDSVSHDMARL